jgi:hypothetical protein
VLTNRRAARDVGRARPRDGAVAVRTTDLNIAGVYVKTV